MSKQSFKIVGRYIQIMTKKSEDPRTSYMSKEFFIWFGLAALLMAGAALLSHYHVGKSQTAMEAFVSKNAVLAGLFHQLENDLRERQHLIERISQEHDYFRRKIHVDKHQSITSAVDKRINYLHATLILEKEKSLVDAIQKTSKRSISLYQAVISHMDNGNYEQALISYSNSMLINEKISERLDYLMFVERSNKGNIIDDMQIELEELALYSVLISVILFMLLLIASSRTIIFSIAQKNRLAASRKALTIARDEVEEAERVRVDFIANMSHELRTPMTSIKGVLGILNSDMIENIPLEAKNLCQIADGSADKLLALIIDMLDFSKISAGEFELVYKVFDIENELTKSIISYEQKAVHKNLGFSLSFDHSLPKSIQSDAHCITQIIGQLLNNAIKFTRKGKVEVDVIYLENKKMIKIVVTDTGVGVSENEFPKMFEYFLQGDGSLTREYSGTGLGLALCKQLATALGGNIGAEKNPPGGGSIFWFTVPIDDIR